MLDNQRHKFADENANLKSGPAELDDLLLSALNLLAQDINHTILLIGQGLGHRSRKFAFITFNLGVQTSKLGFHIFNLALQPENAFLQSIHFCRQSGTLVHKSLSCIFCLFLLTIRNLYLSSNPRDLLFNVNDCCLNLFMSLFLCLEFRSPRSSILDGLNS